MGLNFTDLAKKDPIKVVGLISGTSCDGVDAALCSISGDETATFKVEVLAFETESYSPQLQKKLLEVCDTKVCNPDELCRINFRVGETFARAAAQIVEKAKLKNSDVDLVGTHGQTIAHLPPRTDIGNKATGMVVKHGSTLQIGEPAVIAERIGAPVVSNFRTRDMAAGGQGAPLVPYVDYLLLAHPEKTRAVINIGGISNITYLPKGCKPEQVMAFDSGPGNMIIDAMIQLMSQGKERYDKNGERAAQGHVDGYILSKLLQHPFLALEPPKSTGREEFGQEYAKHIYQWGITRSVVPTDTLRTVTDFTAITLAEAYKKHLVKLGKVDEVIVSGGGALNKTLMTRLKKEFGEAPIGISDDYGLPMKGKEAIAFAVLALETIRGRPGNLAAATGAAGPRILGQITPA